MLTSNNITSFQTSVTMKKDKVKSAKRTVRDDIKLNLIKELKALTGKFGNASGKLEKEISKSAKKLAKTISKEIKVAEATHPAAPPQPKAVTKVVKASDKKIKVA
jgi:hypothetical protein